MPFSLHFCFFSVSAPPFVVVSAADRMKLNPIGRHRYRSYGPTYVNFGDWNKHYGTTMAQNKLFEKQGRDYKLARDTVQQFTKLIMKKKKRLCHDSDCLYVRNFVEFLHRLLRTG
jgi:hypothetical protein